MDKMIKASIVLIIIGIIGLVLRQTALSEVLIPIGKVSWSTFEPVKVSLPDIIAGLGFGTCAGIWAIYLKLQ